MLKLHRQTLDPRRAGQVSRCHTWTRTREQSIGEHSWQVARLLLAIWPEAPRHVLVHALFHDIGEVVTGDLPYPVKKLDAALGPTLTGLENEAYDEMCAPWKLPPREQLTPEEKAIFKLAEFLEMWEWAELEVSSGNLNGHLVARRCMAGVLEHTRRLLVGHPDVVARAELTDVVARAELMLARRRHHERDVRAPDGIERGSD